MEKAARSTWRGTGASSARRSCAAPRGARLRRNIVTRSARRAGPDAAGPRSRPSSRPSGPSYVFLAAAKVGGIGANSSLSRGFHLRTTSRSRPTSSTSAHEFGVKKLLNLGSSCIYPKMAPQPLQGGVSPLGAPGADERGLRRRQDRGDPACASTTTINTAQTTSAPCRPTCTDQATTTTPKARTSCPP